MKKLSKSYIISNQAKNANGFRVRTAGIDLVDYNANPLMLWMHKRPKGDSKEEVLPPGNMVDLKIHENTLMGTPSFDEDDAFALSLFNKYENGTLRALSPGLIPLKWGKDEHGDIWLEQSKLKEVSLVDIGSNAEALGVTLYDETDKVINLSLTDIQTILKPDNTMKLITLNAPDILPLLTLAEGATPEEVQEAIGNLVTLANDQKLQIGTLTTEKTDLQVQLDAQVKLANDTKIVSLLDGAEAQAKFVVGDRQKWLALAEKDFDGTKAVLDSMPANKSVIEQLNLNNADNALLKLSYDDLDKSNQLIKLKADNIEAFKEKYKAKFGTEYKGN